MSREVYILVIFFLTISTCYSQVCVKLDYTFKTNIEYEYIENYSMIFNENKSLCIEKDTKIVKSKILNTKTDKGVTTNYYSSRKNLAKQFYYNDKKNFYFKEINEDIELLVKENHFDWNWKLENIVKKIGKFNCKKAIINYRGREYTAWYTSEIAVSFGPWKFQGLPGLILEVYDTNKEFHIFSNKIQIQNNKCSIIVDEKQFNKAISLRVYLKKKDSLIDNVFAKMSSRRPKGARPLKRDKSCEDCSKDIEIFNEKN